jgi:hypothetical protein
MNNDFADLADCCPSCHPGDHPAVPPILVVDDGVTLMAAYQHACGAGWECSWPAAAWPVSDPQPIGELLPGVLAVLLAATAGLSRGVDPERKAS